MRSILLCSAIALLSAFASPAKDANSVTWHGKTYASDAVPNDLDAGARAAIVSWTQFAKEHALRFQVDDKCRIVVLSPADGTVGEHAWPLVVRTLDVFESALPAPAHRAVASEPHTPNAKKPGASTPLPEDPEEPPAGAPAKPSGKAQVKPASAKTPVASSDDLALDHRVAVLLLLRDGREFSGALDFVAKAEPYLASWLPDARKQSGFALERPLCGAMVVNQPDQEEWNPDNEVVNRCMQTLVLRRFGSQPYWVMQGLGWYAEFNVLKSVYCFPYREGFVSVAEHTDWDKLLTAEFKDRAKRPLDLAEFAEWRRSTWDSQAAHLAWGAIDHWARTKPRELSAALEDFRQEIETKSRVDQGDGTWTRNRSFELSVDDQRRILCANLGAKAIDELANAWRTGAAGHH